jgi:hypothetical protein
MSTQRFRDYSQKKIYIRHRAQAKHEQRENQYIGKSAKTNKQTYVLEEKTLLSDAATQGCHQRWERTVKYASLGYIPPAFPHEQTPDLPQN